MIGLMRGILHRPHTIDPETPLNSVRFVAVDTELTGLDERDDCIVSIGAVRMTGGVIDIGDTFYQLINPEKQLAAGSVVIHEITPSEVSAKPPVSTVLADFLEFAGEDVLMGHFFSLDLSFLNREMKRFLRHRLLNPVLDTFSIYQWLAKRLKTNICLSKQPEGYRLYDIVKSFDLPVSGAHNALMDAYTAALLFQRFIPLLEEAGVTKIGDLLGIGKPFQGGDRFPTNGEFSNF